MDCNCSLYCLCVSPCQRANHTKQPVLVEPRHLSYLLRQDTWSTRVLVQERELAEPMIALTKECHRMSKNVISFVSRYFEREIMTVLHLKDVLTRRSLCVRPKVKQQIVHLSNHEDILQCFFVTIEWYEPHFLEKFLVLLFEGRNNNVQNVIDEIESYKKALGQFFVDRMFENGLYESCPTSGKLTPIACIKTDRTWSKIPAQDIGRVCNQIQLALQNQTGKEYAVWFCSILYATVFEIDKSMLVCGKDCIEPCTPPLVDVDGQTCLIKGPCSEPYPPPYKMYLPSGKSQVQTEPPNPICHTTWLPENSPVFNNSVSHISPRHQLLINMCNCTSQSLLHPFQANAGMESKEPC